MPTFDVTIRGRSYHIEIPDPGQTPLTVIVDGQPFEVNFASGAAPSQDQPALAPTGAPTRAPTPAPPPGHVVSALPAAQTPISGGSRIVAPMPGTILSVEVAAGASVDTGQVLCVLEAMKMKNPIRATAPGTVAEIAVQPGQNVRYGDLLVLLA